MAKYGILGTTIVIEAPHLPLDHSDILGLEWIDDEGRLGRTHKNSYYPAADTTKPTARGEWVTEWTVDSSGDRLEDRLVEESAGEE